MEFPESYEEVLSCANHHAVMSSKEHYAYTVSRGQQGCLKALLGRLEGRASEH